MKQEKKRTFHEKGCVFAPYFSEKLGAFKDTGYLWNRILQWSGNSTNKIQLNEKCIVDVVREEMKINHFVWLFKNFCLYFIHRRKKYTNNNDYLCVELWVILNFYHSEFCNLFFFTMIKCYLIDLKKSKFGKIIDWIF